MKTYRSIHVSEYGQALNQGNETQGGDTRGNDAKGNDIQGNDIQGNDIQGNNIQGNNIQGNNIRQAVNLINGQRDALHPRRRQILVIIGLAALGSAVLSPRTLWAANASALPGVSSTEASAGLKEALIRGSETAVNLLGKPGGFLDNTKVRIPLPDGLKKAQSVLRMMGKGQQAEELEVAMNRAAESAVQEAKPLLVNAVQTMTVQDAKGILTGGDDSVTTYFKGRTQGPLTDRFLPIVSKEIDKLGLAQMYNQYAGQAAQFGVVRKEDANVQQYVTRKALDGLYLMIGEQERSIRNDPIGTGSALLKKVFGAVK